MEASKPVEDNDDSNQNNETMDLQMQQILKLMSDRVSGKASSEDVEAAVQSLLMERGGSAPPSATSNAAAARATERDEPEIQVDDEDYDDLPVDEQDDNETPSKQTNAYAFASSSSSPLVLPAKRKRGRPSNSDKAKSKPKLDPIDWSLYSDIPLGKQGAQMLVSFGDGSKPVPKTVAACLLGARRMLQVAIQDARYLRRKHSNVYHSASQAVKPQKKRPGAAGTDDVDTAAASLACAPRDEWTPSMLYRATAGFDRLTSAPPCGFDQEDLRQLYPEEMNAYLQWSTLHEEYAAKTKEDTAAVANGEPDNDEDNDDNKSASTQTQQPIIALGGHLGERLAQFDLRTDRMKDDWYLQFSDLRQGSFLPRSFATKGTQSKAWKDYQNDSNGSAGKLGRPKTNGATSSWANMSIVSARFLHWLGFDMETLPPPNNETTAALAYLAYDFYGRIVEKAIYLRNLHASKRTQHNCHDETSILLELQQGEQLYDADIKRALDEINPTPLYSAAIKKKVEPQLYFGPGFEDRLEMEMEELLAGLKEGSSAMTEEEIKQRRAEDELFAKMAEPPAKDGVASLLEEHAASGNVKNDKDFIATSD